MKIIDGDFGPGRSAVIPTLFGKFIELSVSTGFFRTEKFHRGDFASVVLVTQEDQRQGGGNALGGAILGEVLMGPAGLIAGAIMGGQTTQKHLVTFLVTLVDGRKFLACGSSKEFQLLLGASINATPSTAPAGSTTEAGKKSLSATGGCMRFLLLSMAGVTALFVILPLCLFMLFGPAKPESTSQLNPRRGTSPISTPNMSSPIHNTTNSAGLGTQAEIGKGEAVSSRPPIANAAVDDPKNVVAEQPTHDKNNVPSSGFRSWTDASGEHKTEAQFKGMAFGKVKLLKRNGGEVTIPLEKLSEEDQTWIKKRK